MMQKLDNKNRLLELLSEGATLVTPNNRLANELLQHYVDYCGRPTLNKPRCYPYKTALIKAYQQLNALEPYAAHPIVLSKTQCQHLWQKLIKSQASITYTQGLLQAVMEAWEYCEQWNISAQQTSFASNPQTQLFHQWLTSFNHQLEHLQIISEHQLAPYLQHTGATLFSHTLVWVCFDELTPQQISLQDHLNQQGVLQYCYDLEQQNRHTSLFHAKDPQQEYQQVFAWLKTKLAEGASNIGVVIPDLQQQSFALERQLHLHFPPSFIDLSLGHPLSTFPLVEQALFWLQLATQPLNEHEINLLLQSPWIKGAFEEFPNRCQYLQDSSLLQNQPISLPSLIQDLQKTAPNLAQTLLSIKPYPEIATASEWVDCFLERLNTLGFPGDKGLNSQNHQCLNRLIALLDEFRTLHLIQNALKKNEALDALIQLTQNTIFQAQKTNAPIQICGLLEASGCEYDHLWIMGLTDQCLPQKTRLSALIPHQMQKERFMPHSRPERELDFAQKTLQRLQRGSKHLVLSYPLLQGDTSNLPCPLILDYPEYQAIPLPVLDLQHTELESYEESYQVPLKKQELISGGTALLAAQAKCPFKAFAQHRLWAKPQTKAAQGLDDREKGILLHKVMELLWNTLENQKTLLETSTLLLDQYIDKAIHTAFLNSRQHKELLQEVEHIRLKRLIQLSLEWEKQRPCFSIIALEQSYTINLSGLNVAVRIDRLDQVGESKWIIDYKSNLPSAKPWNEERPTEPQLLLYALLNEDINTLVFMQLKTGKVLSSGISDDPPDSMGIAAVDKDHSWQQLKTIWHQQLTLLAQEFQQGHCLPNPTAVSVCERCEFPSLCRLENI